MAAVEQRRPRGARWIIRALSQIPGFDEYGKRKPRPPDRAWGMTSGVPAAGGVFPGYSEEASARIVSPDFRRI